MADYTKLLIVSPIVIPMLTAVVGVFGWRHRRFQRGWGLAGSVLHMAAALALLGVTSRHGIQVVQMGSWPAPFGITIVSDLFGAIMVNLGALMGLATVLYSMASMDPERENFAYYPLLHFLLMGVSGAFLTGDLFNLYVWFEVLLIASFVLLALGGERAQLEGSIKYVTLNLLSSAIFLAAVGILYSEAGTLNMADLSVQLSQRTVPQGLTVALAMMFLVAFGIKAAIFPLFFWLPASYHTPPAAISAIFAGLLTKVGVYSLIRVFTLIFIQDVGFTHTLIVWLAGLTMVTGVLGAAAQFEFRRVLSFHIISQIGYMIMGLGLFTPLALAGSVFYLVHHIIVKTNLFLVSGLVYRLRGTYQLQKLGGLYRAYPVVAAAFLVPAFSLAGVPPLSGFWAKLVLVVGALELRSYFIVAAALVTSLLTLYSMTKIWNEAFWKPLPRETAESVWGHTSLSRRAWVFYLIPILGLAALTVTIGLCAEPFFALALRAADQLMHPEIYIDTVLGAPPPMPVPIGGGH